MLFSAFAGLIEWFPANANQDCPTAMCDHIKIPHCVVCTGYNYYLIFAPLLVGPAGPPWKGGGEWVVGSGWHLSVTQKQKQG